MRGVVGYQAKSLSDGSVGLSRCDRGILVAATVTTWGDAIDWLLRPPAGSDPVFTVCFSLYDFSKALFSLLPPDERKRIEGGEDRVFFEDCKVFYVGGRYLGLTATIPVNPDANQYRRVELNLQALKWWVSEDEDEPADAKEVWTLGARIVKALDGMGFQPTKLTSPVAVFADCYLGDARKYPTIFSWPEEKLEALQYAEELMRFEWRSAYQVGYFQETHLWDRVSAYPAAIRDLPSTDDCRCEHSETVPDWAQWGVMYGEVQVDVDVSPLVFDMGDGTRINPKGRWKGCFTTGEIKWLDKWGAGRFTMEDGWFFRFGKERPYRVATDWLFTRKQSPDTFLSGIARKASQGLSGKLDEDRQDGKKGDYYNPVLACMVRSQCRLRVADFIYQNKLQPDLIAVLVDSVLATSAVDLPESEGTGRMGSWRYEGLTPAVVLSKGAIWRPGKRPQGISYEALLDALKGAPGSAYYEFVLPSGTKRSIDLMLDGSDLDRNFGQYPETGADVLSRVVGSTAIEIGRENE